MNNQELLDILDISNHEYDLKYINKEGILVHESRGKGNKIYGSNHYNVVDNIIMVKCDGSWKECQNLPMQIFFCEDEEDAWVETRLGDFDIDWNENDEEFNLLTSRDAGEPSTEGEGLTITKVIARFPICRSGEELKFFSTITKNTIFTQYKSRRFI